MGYQEFLCVVEKNLNQRLEGGITASVHVTVKNNGKIKQGILVEDPQVNISPTIYLEEFYERFQNGESLEEILNSLLKFYETVRCKQSWDTKEVEQFEEAKHKIVFKVVHRERNQELLEQVPHIDLLDLSILFYVLLDIKEEGTATMLIRKEHLKLWEIQENELFPLACANGIRLLPAQLHAMKDLMEELMNPEGEKPENLLERTGPIPQDVMYVLSNPLKNYGAAAFFYGGIMEEIAQLLQGDYYILPSSVHEMILVPGGAGFDAGELTEMVQDVNASQVELEEQLSNHVYFYDWKKKQLEMR